MIQKVKIQKFKSVQDLELELGRLNVFIGENGCGKTNILEAIAMGSAAVENKVDNEFLTVRGIRMTDYQFMISAFELNSPEEVSIEFEGPQKKVFQCQIFWNEKKVAAILSSDGQSMPSNAFDGLEQVGLSIKNSIENPGNTLLKTVSSRQNFIE